MLLSPRLWLQQRLHHVFIDEFQDRLLLGLDYCSVQNDMQHIEWLTQLRDEKHISNEAYEKIMFGNIRRVLKLDVAE